MISVVLVISVMLVLWPWLSSQPGPDLDMQVLSRIHWATYWFAFNIPVASSGDRDVGRSQYGVVIVFEHRHVLILDPSYNHRLSDSEHTIFPILTYLHAMLDKRFYLLPHVLHLSPVSKLRHVLS